MTARENPAYTPLMPAPNPPERQVFVCSGPRCARRGSRFVRQALEKAVRAGRLAGSSRILRTQGGCLGQCELGPNVTVRPEGTRYFGVTPSDADEIAFEHLTHGRPVGRLLYSVERFPEPSEASPSARPGATGHQPPDALSGRDD